MNISLASKIITALLLSFSILGCKFENNSTTKHQLGEMVATNKKWSHVSTSAEKLIEYRSDQIGNNPITPISSESNIYKLIQSDVDLIDRTMRDLFPEQLKDVPTPKLVISEEDIFNAFVTGYPVCYDLETRIGGFFSFGTIDAVEYNFRDGGISLASMSQAKHCLKGSVEKLDAFLVAQNKAEKKCKIVRKDAKLELKGKCEKRGLLLAKKASKFIIIQPLNIITVYKGLIKGVKTRAELIGVLAHELAHYYRGHVVSFQDEYGYFYNAKERKNAKPTPDLELNKIGAKLVEATELITATSRMNNQRNGIITPHTYLVVGGVASIVSKEVPECASVSDKVKGNRKLVKELNAFPYGVANPDALKELSTELESCYEAFKKSGKMSDVSVFDAVYMSNFVDTMAHDIMVDFEKYTYNYYYDYFKEEGRGFLATEFIDNSESIYKSRLNKAYTLHKNSQRNFLGWYTDEQEADEVGTEILSHLGLSGNELVNYYLNAVQRSRPMAFWGDMIQDKASCVELYEKGFKDEKGSIVSVPIGRFTNEHHSSCYRLYNLVLEAEFHEFSFPEKQAFNWKDKEAEFQNIVSSMK